MLTGAGYRAIARPAVWRAAGASAFAGWPASAAAGRAGRARSGITADPGRARVAAGQAIRADAAFAQFGTSEVVPADDVGAAGSDPGAGMGMCLVCDAAGRYRRSVQSGEFPVVVIAQAVSC